MQRPITTVLSAVLSALLALGCSDPEVPSDTLQVSTSTGDEPTGGSSSSTGEPSWSTGEDPDPRPKEGLFKYCEQDDETWCPGGKLICLQYPEEWGEWTGVCTKVFCESAADCIPEGGLPKSGAKLVCAPLVPTVPACLLSCEDHDECPGGMICLELPQAKPEDAVQKVCV